MGAGLDSSLPQLVWARESEKPPEFRVLSARRPARDWKGGRGGGALRGGAGGRRTARSSGAAASMGRRQRPPAPAPRKHSPRRAHSGDPELGRAAESLLPPPPPPRGRARMGAGGDQGARGAGRAGEILGLGKAAGCAQRRDWPRRGGLGPRPEPARWAGHWAWTPPLTPVRPRGETWRFGKGELV